MSAWVLGGSQWVKERQRMQLCWNSRELEPPTFCSNISGFFTKYKYNSSGF